MRDGVGSEGEAMRACLAEKGERSRERREKSDAESGHGDELLYGNNRCRFLLLF
jgi:hypothetical protein